MGVIQDAVARVRKQMSGVKTNPFYRNTEPGSDGGVPQPTPVPVYQQPPRTIDNPGLPPELSAEARATLDKYRAEAFAAPGSSPWEKMMNDKISSQQGVARDDLAANQAAQMAQMRSMAKMRGGASAWLNPALARGSVRQGIESSQGIFQRTNDARLDASTKAEEMRQGARDRLLGAEVSYFNPDLQSWTEIMKARGGRDMAEAIKSIGGGRGASNGSNGSYTPPLASGPPVYNNAPVDFGTGKPKEPSFPTPGSYGSSGWTNPNSPGSYDGRKKR